MITPFVAGMLGPLAVYLLISGVDDLLLDVACLVLWLRRLIRRCPDERVPSEERLQALAERRIAIFVPLWGEHQVIGKMLEHNLAAIKYSNYDFFVGCYPNDPRTLEAVRALAKKHRNIHQATCPHDGPTSKADCLNWIYQRMMLYEEDQGAHFEIVMTHDAEDMIHPESLRWINAHSDSFDMVQIPVLPLPTPLRQWTHGIYCDEFAEYQTKDMPARAMLGGFTPSNGVGTSYGRAALERLAEAESNRIFDPACLTEDYENGLRLHRLGCRQLFVPLAMRHGSLVATREYFPHSFKGAVRQRTRWIMGIALQSWERYGWSGNLAQVYWFWRDRKGLIGNPVSLLTNVIFLYGVATFVASRIQGTPWALGEASILRTWVFRGTLLLQLIRTGVRMGCVGRYYGWWFALGVPLRTLYGNFLNSAANAHALFRYARARWRREPLVWLKTEHAYPSRAVLLEHKRKLGEILVGSEYLTVEDLEVALATQPAGVKLGKHLVALRKLSEDELYEALSFQQGLPAGRVNPREVSRKVARALPAHVIEGWQVLPFRVATGSLYVAGPELPTDEMGQVLQRFTRLEIRFQLVTPENFEELKKELL